ncbi:response regulator [Rubrivivax sp. RP6-9]|uniref:response regulator n=1 Tax=Rubrivivax sp. RP6-9 TaxID=3415750 RepID=UPI003CC667F1
MPPGTDTGRGAAPIRVLVVDDHALLRAGIVALLQGAPGMTVVAEACNGREALAAFDAHRPDVTLMDIQMPELDGLAAVAEIRRTSPAARIVMLTTFPGDAPVRRALQQGAAGYLLKSVARTELVDTIRLVHAGGRYVQHDAAIELARHLGDDALSGRELVVLRRVGAGLSNKRVAGELGLSEDTIKSHMKNVIHKLRANDRTHAVTIALRRGLMALAETA